MKDKLRKEYFNNSLAKKAEQKKADKANKIKIKELMSAYEKEGGEIEILPKNAFTFKYKE